MGVLKQAIEFGTVTLKDSLGDALFARASFDVVDSEIVVDLELCDEADGEVVFTGQFTPKSAVALGVALIATAGAGLDDDGILDGEDHNSAESEEENFEDFGIEG